MKVAAIEVALAQETTDALVNPPVELIAVTNGRTVEDEAKFVPVIVTDVVVLGNITKLVDVIVGFVSCALSKLKFHEPSVFKKYPFVILCGKVNVYDCAAECGGAFI